LPFANAVIELVGNFKGLSVTIVGLKLFFLKQSSRFQM
jgi:hypothetical protein